MQEETPAELGRKAEIVRAGVRVSAAGGGVWLARIFGPAAAASVAQAMAEVGEMLVGTLVGWEQRRILRTVQGFKDQIESRLAAGEVLREEIIDPNSRAAAELFEAAAEAAARSIEEKKCDLIANLYASVAFEKGISIEDALLYLRRIRAASWRQLVALRYFEDDERREERELIGAVGAEGDARIHPALEQELSELARTLELIGIGQDGGAVANPANTVGGGTITTRSTARLRGTGLGETISRLGRLAELVSGDELEAVRRDLQSDRRDQEER